MRVTRSAVLLLAAITMPARANDSPKTVRQNQEAKLLFAAVLKDIGENTRSLVGACGLGPEWSPFRLDYWIAHKDLGPFSSVDLRPSTRLAKPAEVFGSSVSNDAFCDADAVRRFMTSRVTMWEAASKALRTGERPPPDFSMFVSSFSRPYFDHTLRHGVVVKISDNYSFLFYADGRRRRLKSTIGRAYFYDRGPQGWISVGSKKLFQVS